MDYAAYGLDAVKKSQDDAQKGARYCPWCQNQVSKGFSLCFSNFVICPDCVASAYAPENAHRWIQPEGEDGCFKCDGVGKRKKQYSELYLDKARSLSFCPDCINWAEATLFPKPPEPDPAPDAAPDTEPPVNNQNTAEMNPVNTQKPTLHNLSVKAIAPDPNQPRKIFRDASLKELAESIKANGVIQPIVVRAFPDQEKGTAWRIITGERRWRASLIAGLELIPAIRNESMDDKQILEVQIIENLQREGVHPLEEALAFEELGRQGLTQKEIGARVGKGDRFVRERLALTRLSKAWRELFMDGGIKLEQAMLLVKLAPELQDDFLKKNKPERGETLSFSDWALREYSGDLAKAPFDLKDPTLNKKLGACVGCRFNSATAPITALDRESPTCGLKTCYSSKIGVHFDRQLQAAKASEEEVIYVRNVYHNHGADKKVQDLRQAGEIVFELNQVNIVEKPEPILSWEAYLEDYRENYDDGDSEAQIRKQYDDEVKQYERDRKHYENKVTGGHYKKALIVDGDGRGTFVLAEVKGKGKEKTARQAIESGEARIEDLQIEAARIQRDIESQEARLEDQVQGRIADELLAHPATRTELKPFTHADLAGLAFVLFQMLDDDLLDRFGAYDEEDEEYAFAKAIGIPVEDENQELDMDTAEGREKTWSFLMSLEPQKLGLVYRRAIAQAYKSCRASQYGNAGKAFILKKLAESVLGPDWIQDLEEEERRKAGKRLSNARQRLEKLLADIRARQENTPVKGRKKGSKAKAEPTTTLREEENSPQYLAETPKALEFLREHAVTAFPIDTDLRIQALTRGIVLPADPAPTAGDDFSFPDDLDRIPTAAGEIRGSAMDVIRDLETEFKKQLED